MSQKIIRGDETNFLWNKSVIACTHSPQLAHLPLLDRRHSATMLSASQMQVPISEASDAAFGRWESTYTSR
ncbi:unnamed protein product [Larinioides sclopetarius]|uniref:Uncharacterized protein n=1 Tax=Larinioides sclopetarius TaxID=280406 RepID=A0AAV1Z142_9ARAC